MDEKQKVISLIDEGNALQQAGNLEKALACFEQALAILPENPGILYNIANLHRDKKNPEKAAGYYRKAIEIAPHFTAAHNNLGNILFNEGKFTKALYHYKQAAKTEPANVTTHYNVTNALFSLGDYKQLNEYAAKLDKGTIPPEMLEGIEVTCAIAAYLENDMAKCASFLKKVKNIAKTKLDFPNINNYREYFSYLKTLLAYRENNAGGYKEKGGKEAYIIGDSHALSPAHTRIGLRGGDYFAVPKLVIGAKAWHLGRKENNRYKTTFENIMAEIPEKSLVIAIFGEIDCRSDEGIFRQYKKKPGYDIQAEIKKLVGGYVTFVEMAARKRGVELLICGVPAPYADLSHLNQKEQAVFLDMIRSFNDELKKAAEKTKLGFIDVYKATNTANGKADGSNHIDPFHLKPDVMAGVVK